MIFRLIIKRLLSQKLFTALITAAISLAIAIFLTFTQSISEYKNSLSSVAEENILVAGGTQGHLKTIFNAIYFKNENLKTYKISDLDKLKDFGSVIPVFNKYSTLGKTIAGIKSDYFNLNNISFSKGATFVKIGQCVIGREVANEYGLKVGDDLISDADAAFDLSKAVPVKMKITGILNAKNAYVDQTVFTSLKTTWTIHGIGHEHKENEEATVELVDLTKEKLENFHFHGDEKDFPVTSAIIFTNDLKAKAEMQALALADKFPLQIINPRDTLDQINESISGVSKFFYFLFTLISIALAILLLVFFFQSSKIRAREKARYDALGIPGSFYFRLIIGEWIILFSISILLGVLISIALRPLMTQKILNILTS
ncbi:MAG: ABC transporter permease [Lentisphaeraceae bacterium]|nr:ABC transporter permease [Lentisphaeraceae bacterium]